ncbi:MAG: MBL fold metallo-hydrolase [Candidatus Sumerlaeota bacterium]|nr:MBL fold metallo-hydrolase [Candidatus Sumerlaeota bacterium]
MVKLTFTFLGTAASEEYPAVFCRCEHCAKARALGGRNVRVQSSAHLSPDCLIDFNHGSVYRAQEFGISLPDAQHVLVTHVHEDHLAPGRVRCRRMNPSVALPVVGEARKAPESVGVRFCELPMLHVYGNRRVCEALRVQGQDPDPAVYRLQLHEVGYFETFQAGDMRCTTLKADHMGQTGEPGLNYIIERDGRTILYALDTGWYPRESLERIFQFQYDLVVAEGTFGLGREDPKQHFNLAMAERALALFRDRGLLKPGAPFCVSHLCPHWTPVHDEIAPVMAEKGVTIAYDGLSVDL